MQYCGVMMQVFSTLLTYWPHFLQLVTTLFLCQWRLSSIWTSADAADSTHACSFWHISALNGMLWRPLYTPNHPTSYQQRTRRATYKCPLHEVHTNDNVVISAYVGPRCWHSTHLLLCGWEAISRSVWRLLSSCFLRTCEADIFCDHVLLPLSTITCAPRDFNFGLTCEASSVNQELITWLCQEKKFTIGLTMLVFYQNTERIRRWPIC